MIIKRYRNGVLVTEEIKIDPSTRKEVITTTNLPKATPMPTQVPNGPTVPTAPKKGCGCGGRK